LWDPTCLAIIPDDKLCKEWHYHIYGSIGLFFIDMRGNRINGQGETYSKNKLISEEQWNDIINFTKNKELKIILMMSEIPFVGDSPEIAKKNAEKITFLEDHWP